jgi:hypothetical protein
VSICDSTICSDCSTSALNPFVVNGYANVAYPCANAGWTTFMSGLLLKLAGLVENIRGTSASFVHGYAPNVGSLSYWTISNYNIYSVTDNKNIVSALGMPFSGTSFPPSIRGYYISGLINFTELNGLSVANGSAYSSSGFKRIIYQNPYLFYYYSVPPDVASCVDNDNAMQSGCNPRGGLTAHVSRMIDEKYDDGKPYEGLILAVKPALVNKSYTDAGGVYKPKDVADTANYCTSMQFIRGTTTSGITDNGTGTKYNDYQVATYVTNTTYSKNIQYGCNMVFGIEK